jgi:hypothetical protein
VISWATILAGAAMTAAFTTAALVLIGSERHPAVLIAAVTASTLAPIAWNAVLRAIHANQFFTDAPITVMPASWQDTGSGIVTFGAVAAALGAGPQRDQPAKRVVALAAIAAPSPSSWTSTSTRRWPFYGTLGSGAHPVPPR